MPMLHFARRQVAALATLSLVLAACGDSAAPDAPFDPAGTSSDIAAINEAFNSEAVASFNGVSVELNTIAGGVVNFAVAAKPSARAVSSRSGAMWYSRKVAQLYRSGSGARPSFSSASIPEQYLGKTFEYNVDSNHYEVTDRAGAPTNGVRFILYSIDPVTGKPTEPLNEVGYAQVVVTGSTSGSTKSVSAHLTVVSDTTTYLDYGVAATADSSASTATISIDGFVTNGTDRANFNLTFQATSTLLSLDFATEVPTRNFRVALDFSFQNMGSGNVLFTISLQARGEHGRVTIAGTTNNESGSLTVRVNGDLYATITFSGSGDPVFTGADGHALTAEELQALQKVFGVFDGSYDVYGNLLAPLN